MSRHDVRAGRPHPIASGSYDRDGCSAVAPDRRGPRHGPRRRDEFVRRRADGARCRGRDPRASRQRTARPVRHDGPRLDRPLVALPHADHVGLVDPGSGRPGCDRGGRRRMAGGSGRVLHHGGAHPPDGPLAAARAPHRAYSAVHRPGDARGCAAPALPRARVRPRQRPVGRRAGHRHVARLRASRPAVGGAARVRRGRRGHRHPRHADGCDPGCRELPAADRAHRADAHVRRRRRAGAAPSSS